MFAGSQVAVHDPLRMRVRERLCHRLRVPRSLSDIERQPPERRVGEVAAVDELHDEERLLSVVHEVVHPDDVLVREPGESSRLPLEPAPLLPIGRDERPKKLDRHVAAERAVMRPPHHSHSALADEVEQPVSPDERRYGPRCRHSSTPPPVRFASNSMRADLVRCATTGARAVVLR